MTDKLIACARVLPSGCEYVAMGRDDFGRNCSERQAESEEGMTVDHTPCMEVSPYEADGGQKVGKLPGSVRLEQLRLLGHPESPVRAIRANCLDCSGGVASEVRKCVAVTCSLWPFRMGSNPFHGKKGKCDRDSTG